VISSHGMSGACSRRSVQRLVSLFSATLVLVCAGCTKDEPGRAPHREATLLYNQGKYAEALPLLRKAQETGLKDGTLLYQLGYCREVVEGKPDGRRETWNEAGTLLAQEVTRRGGSSLERLYDLSVIHSDRQEWDTMKQYARQAIEQFEKGSNPNELSGEDWFRLGRLHDLLVEPSEAEAAYRRSVSAFTKEKEGSPIYQSLALAKVGDYDLRMVRYRVAAEEFDLALKLFPANTQVRPFTHGLALLASHRFEEAAARFAADRSDTNTESQYGADLARKSKDVAPLEEKDTDGASFRSLPEAALQTRVLEAAKAFRAAREKNSYRPGDSLAPEVAVNQKRFCALMGEYFVRTQAIQDFCTHEGIADLVRR
jgi:tetratricopeptide (TPR) repeat protein